MPFVQRLFLSFSLLLLTVTAWGKADTTKKVAPAILPIPEAGLADSTFTGIPRISLTTTAPQDYVIRKIDIVGASALDPDVILKNLPVTVGDTLAIPSENLSLAARSLLDRRFFSDLKVETELDRDSVDITLYIKERVRITGWQFEGTKGNDQKTLTEKLRLRNNSELSDYLIANCERLIKEYYNEKAYRSATVRTEIVADSIVSGAANVIFYINRGPKVKIGEIVFTGNDHLSSKKLEKSMKSTHKKSWNIFKSAKFKQKEFGEDLKNVRNYARSKGYRDAWIVSDSLYLLPKPNRMGIKIDLSEGNLYHYRNISWVGNTLFPTKSMQETLGLTEGDVYDSETMDKRLKGNDPADMSIQTTYLDRGYLGIMIDPVETVVPGDSVDVQIRMVEGSQYRIRDVTFTGNTRTNDPTIRRELYTVPGELYSQSLLMHTFQRLASMEQFDATKLMPDVQPLGGQELVDISYALTEVPADQVELSGGWGGGMFIASVSVTFSNVSLRHMFNRKAWSFYPTGDNQSISFKFQTNGSYYRAGSVSFTEPWLGGRRPTALSVNFFTSRETNAYYFGQKATAYFGTIGGGVNISKRINWPDPYFSFSFGVSAQSYNLNNWNYFIVKNGRSNTLAFNLGFMRNSINDPQYPSQGSNFALTVSATPPWSLFDGKDYSKPMPEGDRYKWIEYHKWKLNAQWFFSLDASNKMVLMARARYGYLGSYNPYKPSPFEGFQMGGDGLSGYSLYGVETIGLRGYRNMSLTPGSDYGVYANIFSKYTAELRYPLVRNAMTMVYGLVFAEAGNAYTLLSEFKPFDLKRSLGIGMRVYLPYLGMLGIDWGYGFDRVASSGTKPSGAQFHFSMGLTD